MTPLDYTFILRGKRLSSIAIMSTRGIEDIDTFEGSINGDIFSDFITRCYMVEGIVELHQFLILHRPLYPRDE